MRGGARANSGAKPDPEALRPGASRPYLQARANDGWIDLLRRTMHLPLLAAQQSVSRGAPALEGELYKTPQSTQWQPHQRYDVATYVRLTTADQTSVDVKLSAERRHLGGALGLSSAGMRSNTWRRTGEHAPAVTTLRAVPPRTPPPPEPVSEGFRATPRSEAVRGQLVSPGSLPIATDA